MQFSFCVAISGRSNHRSYTRKPALKLLPLYHLNFSSLEKVQAGY